MTLSSQLGGVPDRIGRYSLMQRLAVGGMAELFLARVKGLEGFEKVVVLKRILPHLAEDQDFVQMFLKEARLAATLDHPNIAHVHDIGREDGEYFFTMEYLHGENLSKVVGKLRERGERLPLRHALSITREVAAGLHFAHEQVGFDGKPLGIVHRDVSPSNVLVTYAGGVKVVDFGIAKAAGPTHASRLSGLKGKAAYMSPEQCRARELDRRSDVFAIGLLLFELVIGAPAFVAGNDLAVLHRVARGDVPDPRMVWPQCPIALRDIIVRAVALEPDDRYPTALQMQLALEGFAHEAHVPLSNAALGQYMLELFGDRPLPWLDGDRKAKLQLAPKRERTPATRAKAMPQVAEAAPIEATVIASPERPEHTVVAASSGVGAVDMRGGSTEKVPHGTIVVTSNPLGRRRRPLWVAALLVPLVGGIAWLSWPQDAPRPVPSGDDAVVDTPGGEPLVEAAAVAVDAEPREAEPAAPHETEPPVSPTVVGLEAGASESGASESHESESGGSQSSGSESSGSRSEAAADGPVEPERAADDEPSGARPRKPVRRKGRARDTPARPSSPPPEPKAEPTGPKHSRPDLPGNKDKGALLPY